MDQDEWKSPMEQGVCTHQISLDDRTNAQQSKSQYLATRDATAASHLTQTTIKQEKPAELDVNAQSAPHRCNPNEQSKKWLPEIQHSGVTITN